MSDLISREALIAEINRIGGHWLCGWDTAGVLSLAHRISAVDAVEVVRCKDCRHWSNYTLSCDMLLSGGSTEHVNWYENDFCSYGERREENELVER